MQKIEKILWGKAAGGRLQPVIEGLVDKINEIVDAVNSQTMKSGAFIDGAIPVGQEEWAAALRGNKWVPHQDADSEMLKTGYKESGSELKGVFFRAKDYAVACGVDLSRLPLELGNNTVKSGLFSMKEELEKEEKSAILAASDYGNLEEFKSLEPWKEPAVHFDANVQSFDLLKKAELLIRMQSWADRHNDLDGFIPDWTVNEYKWGIDINTGEAVVSYNTFVNSGLFQISVGSEARAAEMLEYFSKEINELIKLKLI